MDECYTEMAEKSEMLIPEDTDDINTHRVVDFNAKYFKKKTQESVIVRFQRRARECISARSVKSCLLNNLPIIRNMRRYKIRQFMLNDILSGITVGIMQIPQGTS